MGNLDKLLRLSLGKNQLTGTIPTQLGDLDNLTFLGLSSNQLTGSIPPELGNLTNLEGLYLNNNQLTGELLDYLTGLTNLVVLSFYSNPGLCASIDESFQTWLQSIVTVQGSSCATEDSQADRAVLVKLYDATDGANWNDSSNWLSDRPVREWHGVTNDANGRVTGLYLWENLLSGPLPSDLGTLSEMRWLHLWNNQLTGLIPPELGNLSNLEWLYLNNNQLTGSIPPELGNLSNLRGLYLSDNQLTGCIPASLVHLFFFFGDLDQLGLPTCGIPTVTMSVDSASYQVRIDSPIPVTATFSEPVYDFTESDVTVAFGSVSNFVGSDGDSVYTFDVTPNAVGVVTVDIAAGVAQDSDSDDNTAAEQLALGLPYDDDHDGAIGRSEVLEAVMDYFDGRLTGEHILELVRLYFQW